MLGECIVYEFTCKYHYNLPFLYLIPDDLNQTGEIYRKLSDEIYSKKLITIAAKRAHQHSFHYFFIVSNVKLAMEGDGLQLDVAYYVERYADSAINQLRLTSDVFTKFVEIPSHYFFRHETNKKLLDSVDTSLCKHICPQRYAPDLDSSDKG